MLKRYLFTLIALTGLVWGGAAPAEVGKGVMRVGIINSISPDKRQLIINDSNYRLDPNARLRDARDRRSLRPAALSPGRYVQIRIHDEGPGRAGRITYIKLLEAAPKPSSE